MGHFQFFLHLKIKLRFCVFSSFLFGSISCCFTVIPAKHISGTTSNSEKPEILNSAADIFDPTVDVVVRAENSHTPSCLKKNVTRMATGGCFPWPSIECFSHCIRFHSLCLFVCLFLYWNGAFLHKQEGKHIARRRWQKSCIFRPQNGCIGAYKLERWRWSHSRTGLWN